MIAARAMQVLANFMWVSVIRVTLRSVHIPTEFVAHNLTRVVESMTIECQTSMFAKDFGAVIIARKHRDANFVDILALGLHSAGVNRF